ncbi:protease SohB [Mangrovimicrobium sediminis]|uniref:Protease SohB n=1 Tax=Mangrovimicrobium sediminis TaxID=2562682 RepID=A0A4Z0M7D9_9GAMM|nr:protease SohB [Haliea sp. SAOS-164]TGD75316.1 protease SohB [Haliea sp. SAOS-164]
MHYIFEYGLFLAQAVTLVGAVLILVAGIVAIGQRNRTEQHEGHLEIRKLNDKYRHIGESIEAVACEEEELKQRRKARRKEEKQKAKARKGEEGKSRPRLFVLGFDGDMKASATDNLREEITAILGQAQTGDEILVRLESPGGLVHGYGLAASQLRRIRDAGIPLTVAVDKVAASGGYMMACVADRIIAAPFAVIGSIGVLAQLPNFHRLLQKHDIDFELFTAGEYKRTITMFGENTDKGRAKFVQELEDTHVLFKEFVSANRPALDVAAVATGEIWYGSQALDNGLVDALQTSDDFIQQQLKERDVFDLRFVHKKNWQEKLGLATESALERTFLKIWQQGSDRPRL